MPQAKRISLTRPHVVFWGWFRGQPFKSMEKLAKTAGPAGTKLGTNIGGYIWKCTQAKHVSPTNRVPVEGEIISVCDVFKYTNTPYTLLY